MTENIRRYCITGGIGAGKSYVCRIFKKYGVDVYDCDAGAKHLMNTAPDIKKALTALIGNDAYIDSRLNKAVVANFLLSSEDNKQAINAIVHPAVIKDFYSTGLAWMECAILYEAHLEDFVDKVVAVTAPREVRIERVMQRDGISYERASEWVDKQMLQENVESRADYVIVNDGRQSLDSQVAAVLKQIEKDNIN